MGLFSKKHIIVIKRDYDIKWDEDDVNALREFIKTNTGQKLRGLVEDMILNISLNRHDVGQGFRDGVTHCYAYIISLMGREPMVLDKPKVKGPSTIQFESGVDGETTTLPTVRG